ncbi:amino acid permease [Kribbella sp. NBC_01245]|uniref:APC family permease n=1 Tax=Kribbella sp. NBC_01245 TaxID=2903578 RepID=UPI002E287245|nr:amino acid permease [Kribbella sp. NBC_01245]
MAPSASGQTIGRKLPVESAFTRVEDARHRLPRLFGRRDMVVLGLGVMIGSGIFSLSGRQAAAVAGPAVIISFVIAAVVCLLAALCYAELSSTIPVSGSAYTFSYVTFGETWAWLVGWALVLELVTAASIVARVWGAYLLATLDGFGIGIPTGIAKFADPEANVNLVAPALLLLLTFMVVTGTKLSARVLTIVVSAKVAVILLVVIVGATHVKAENYKPFIPAAKAAPAESSPTLLGWILDLSFGPFGTMGIFTAASAIVFAFIGFDLIATASEDARNPRKTVPQGMLLGLGAVTVLYVAMAIVLVGLRPYGQLGGDAPVSEAMASVGVDWAANVVNLGALLALMTVIMVVLIAQSRVLFNMGRDGLLPKGLGRVSRVYSSPARAATAAGAAAIALTLYPKVLELEELLVIGSLFCFAFCAVGVLTLRRSEPNLERGFRVPLVPLIPLLSLAATIWLMLNLATSTWVKFIVWMLVGLAIYGLYGRWHSRLANEDEWDFDNADTDPGTGGLRVVRNENIGPNGKPRGRHMRH